MPRALRSTAAVGLIALLAVAGCSADEPSPASTTTEASAGATTTIASAATTTQRETTTTEAVEPPDLPTGAAWPVDFPDPWIQPTDRGYLAFATTSGLIQVQELASPGLREWEAPVEALIREPPWADRFSTWAPAVLEVPGGWLLFYTAQVTGTPRHCISVAHAERPEGPFLDESTEPLLCPVDAGGAIDPSLFVDVDGSLHLLWKNDGVVLRSESAIWSQPLSPDGRALAGPPTRLIGTDQPWEHPHVEAPSMVEVDGTYWLAYSANWWNQAAYGVGLARCRSVVGPCEKPYDRPLLSSAPGREGPGGGEFFRDRSGRVLLAFHAWLDEPGYPGHRALHLATIDFGTDPPTIRPT